MKPAAFRYHRPRSFDDALALLSKFPEAKLIAGGQSLAPMMNLRLAQPAELIDLNTLSSLEFVTERENEIEVGALTRHQTLATSPVVRRGCPLLAEAAQTIGHYAIRTRGTLGGSLAHADPAAQLPLVAATLEAEIVARSARGERRVPAREFFVSLMTTALEPDEIIVSVRFPKAAPAERHGYLHFSRRQGDFAIVAVAGILTSSELRVGIGGAEDRPIVLALSSEEKKEVIARKATDSVHPTENPRVPAVYRKELVEVLTRRVLRKLHE